MLLEDIQFFIRTYLRKNNGKLKPCPADQWWLKTNFVEYKTEIFKLTDFIIDPVWPQRIWHIEHNEMGLKFCLNDTCSNILKWNTQLSSYPQYCCKKCSGNSDIKKNKFKTTCLTRYNVSAPAKSNIVQDTRKHNAIQKYGVDHPSKTEIVKERMKTTFILNYGVDNPAKDKTVYDKIRKTNLTKYGVEIPIQSNQILNKRTLTNLEKYGKVSPSQVPEIRKKQEQTLLDRYGVKNSKHINIPLNVIDILQNKDKFCELISGKYIQELVEETHLDITTLYKYIQLYECSDLMLKDYGRSSHEREIEQFLIDHNIKYETNNRLIISPRELDFYLPDYNLAIEICGVYYHTEQFGKDKWYHYLKWKQCKDQGITLLTYFDDELQSSCDIIKSKILYLTNTGKFKKIGARKLTISSVSIKDEREFFTKNHIQGFLNNRNITLGAYYGNKLVAALCITNRKEYKEITRFAVDIQYQIPGIFSKLLKYYVRTYNYSGTIVSFSDNCHSNGQLYKTSGFVIDKYQDPSYYYSLRGSARMNRQQFMKAKIKKKYPDIDITMTEEEIMKLLGYQRIWDCGKIKWIIEV